MNKKIAFFVIGILGLLKLILLIVTGSFFGIVYYAPWLAWLALILFLIFTWFFYCVAFKSLYSVRLLLGILLSIAVVICVLGFYTHSIRLGNNLVINNSSDSNSTSSTSLKSNSKNSSTPSLVKCGSVDADKPVSVAGYKTELFVSPLNEVRSFTEGVKVETRIFSLADYADEKINKVKDYKNPIEKTTLKEDIFFDIHKSDLGNMPGVSGVIQLCDKDNMTVSALDKEPRLTSENATGGTWYLHGSVIPKEPGEYRVDAYLFLNGKWILTNRIDKITLTK